MQFISLQAHIDLFVRFVSYFSYVYSVLQLYSFVVYNQICSSLMADLICYVCVCVGGRGGGGGGWVSGMVCLCMRVPIFARACVCVCEDHI